MSSSTLRYNATVLACALALAAPSLHAETSAATSERPQRPLSRSIIEPELHLIWGEGLGSAPMVLAGANLELGLGRSWGLALGGFAAYASTSTLGYLREDGLGGGANLALRFYIRRDWPRAFGIGAAMSWLVVDGNAIAAPRAEAFYRFVFFSHLGVRLHASVGGLILWDTEFCDDQPGPLSSDVELLEQVCAPGSTASQPSTRQAGIWIGFGLAFSYVPGNIGPPIPTTPDH